MLARLILAAALSLPGQADASGLDIKLTGADQGKPVLTITNNTGKACRVVTGSGLGTVAFTKVEQEGKAVAPIPWEVAFGDGLDSLLRERLQPLEPGKSVNVPLSVVKVGPTGLALEMVTWSEAVGIYSALYPITAGKPLTLELAYSVPVTGEGEMPNCPTAMNVGGSSGGVGEDEGGSRWILWAAIGGAGLLLLIGLIILIVARRKKPPAVATVLLLAAALTVGLYDRPAHATITLNDPSLQGQFDACMAIFRAPGGDPAGILPALDAPGVNVTVERPLHPGDTHEGALDRNTIFIYWDPDTPHRYHGSGGMADECTPLYHELHHGWQHNQGTYSMDPCRTPDAGGRTLPRTEVEATMAQNALRRHLGLPERDHYGDIPLPPDGNCEPPEEPGRCEGPDCGSSNGDPHLLTFDHRRYDFQAVGEFILARSGDFQIQVRQTPAPNSRVVSVNTAVAMQVGADKVELQATSEGLVLLVGGQPRKLEPGALPGGGEIDVRSNRASVLWPGDGPRLFVRHIGRLSMGVVVQPADAHAGKLEGLLGDNDGDPANDIRAKGGQPIEPTFANLYPSYADSWRIAQAESLFTYPAGASTETYTDRKFPEFEVDPDDLPNRAIAEALCRRMGVTDPALLIGCILDVALTGQADFAAALAEGQFFEGAIDFGGIPFTVRLDAVGDTKSVEFDGTAGQQVFIDIPVTSLASSCGVLDLRSPAGDVINSGCVINGRGYIDSTTLPAAGKYRIDIEARNSPGVVQLRVLTISDVVQTITPDAPAAQLRLDKPGMVGRYSFAGKKDQKIYFDVLRSTMPSQCGILDLLGPDQAVLTSGCIVSGEGEIDGYVLPADGTYTITVNPNDRNVGDATFRLVNAIDQRGTLTLNGPEVTARIQQSGAAAYFTFSGVAGQRIFIDVPRTTLPSQCGLLDLRDPNGDVEISGCVIGGKGGVAEDDGHVLKFTGTYTLELDPNDRVTGEAVIKLRG